MEMFDSGELAGLLGVEQPDEDDAPAPAAAEPAPLSIENRLG